MSREVRRVPLDWKHPAEPNPYWRSQITWRLNDGGDLPTLHAPEERFVPLHEGYTATLAEWERDRDELAERTGSHWSFSIRWHLTGYDDCNCHPGRQGVTHPREGCATEDDLHAALTAEHEAERPDPADYMPEWDDPDSLGWCLYETVSEGTPVTPVFATAEELIDHLATVGQDWDAEPMRRTAAETLVRQGSSFGSMAVVGGVLYDGADDADLLAERMRS